MERATSNETLNQEGFNKDHSAVSESDKSTHSVSLINLNKFHPSKASVLPSVVA
jgi:hypothetical protein